MRPHVLLGCCLLLLTVAGLGQAMPPRCLHERASLRPRRFLSYNGTTTNITLQVSRRLPHRLATAVMQLFLSDVLGYEDVVTVPAPGDSFPDIVRELSSIRPNGMRSVPPAIMNLEVLVDPDLDFVYYLMETTDGTVVPYGDTVQAVRRGWFIPDSLYKPDRNDWTSFTRPDIASAFALDSYRSYLNSNAKLDGTNRYFCEANYCVNGTYVPNQCEREKCAILLTTYPEETGFVVRHIDALNMYVKVIWLGANLPRVIDRLVKKIGPDSNESLVFLDWSPSHTELVGGRYASVVMPRCDGPESSKLQGCFYELVRVLKFGWSQLPRQASYAWKTFHLANFTMTQYDELITLYKNDPSHDIYSAACTWMRNNEDSWKKWIYYKKEEISIGGIFPFTGSSINAFGIAVAAQMAMDAVNKDSNVLGDYSLIVHLENGECSQDKVMKRFIDYILGAKDYDKLLGVLGPGCSETLEPLAGVSKHYRTAVVSYSAEGMNFEDRNKYPYFFRTIGGNRQFKHAYYTLMKRLGWRRIAALTEDGQKHTEYISYMENFFVNNGMEFVTNAKFPKDDMNNSLLLYLEELRSKRARVIIADVDESVARSLMCAAYEQSMTAATGYVWFLPPWLSHRWYDTAVYNERFNETVPCSEDIMLKAINGHFSIAHAPFAPDTDHMQENKTIIEWKREYDEKCRVAADIAYRGHRGNPYLPVNKDIRSPYAGYAYDAVWTYALAFDKLLKKYPAAISDLHHDKYTNLFVDMIANTNFNGVSGNIQFRGGSSRFSNIVVMQWVETTAVVVGTFYPNISNDKPDIIGGYLDLNVSNIKWFTSDNSIPDDGTERCSFQWISDVLNVDCQQAFIIFVITLFSVLTAVLVGAFFYLKQRYERNYEKKMLLSLNILAPVKLGSLDQWEIPRERIVINRKLGMGAFGTVYGGHALLSEEKGWTAVAVKTLKGGSTTDAKLDFLSEAEAMKRFEHKNIVKLLGVTTKTEPVCTIMEFMLYGDLKNYLLGRRHLVNNPDEESDEVSSSKLTSMAMDIARALSYLAELKYVHRDVACRNCLVNSHRVVKLGDFGMTRLIFENDYYKFNRKGMLPVRWMAPESLSFGKFSQASDVWSFGVLLYEIITFGSLPFQGLSNSEVLELVKSGGTVILPPGVKPQLEGLIKTCWNMDYKKRPHASAIAEFLANSPRLVTPCLDIPLDSMSLDDSAQWRLLPEPGKVSVGLAGGRPQLLPSEHSSAAFSTSPMIGNSASTNSTYISTDLSSTGPVRDYNSDVFEDERTSFLA